jgi:hypothetical protein
MTGKRACHAERSEASVNMKRCGERNRSFVVKTPQDDNTVQDDRGFVLDDPSVDGQAGKRVCHFTKKRFI